MTTPPGQCEESASPAAAVVRFIVVVSDVVTGEVDSYGPFAETVALARADALRTDLSTLEDTDGITVAVLPLESCA